MVVISTEGTRHYYSPQQAEEERKKLRRSKLAQEKLAPQSYPYPQTQAPTQSGVIGEFQAAGRTPAPVLPDPVEQLKMIDRAYVHLHGTHAPGDLAARMLISLPMGRSEDDYVALLSPGLSFGESPTAPSGPGGESEAVKILKGQRSILYTHMVDQTDRPKEMALGGVPAWSESDRSGFMGQMRAVNQPVAWSADTIKYNAEVLRSLNKESHDVDMTPYELAEHELRLRDATAWAEQLIQDRSELKMVTEIDASDPADADLVGLYVEQVVGRNQADYYWGKTPEEKAKALEAMDAAVDAGGLPDAKEIKASFRYQNDIANGLDIDPQMVYNIYQGYLMGRGVGQVKSASMWEYIDKYGRDKLPDEAKKQAEKESTTIWDFLDKTVGTIFRGAGAGLEEGVKDVGEYLNPVDAVTEQVASRFPGKMGDIASVAHDLNEQLIGKVAAGLGVAAEGKIPALGIQKVNQAGATLEDFIFKSGIFDPSEYEGMSMMEKAHKQAQTLTSLRAWKDSWKSSEGKFVVAALAEDLCELTGLPKDNPAITFVAGLGDLYLSIRVGAYMDTAARFGAVKVYRGSFATGRGAYSAYKSGYDAFANIKNVYKRSKLAEEGGWIGPEVPREVRFRRAMEAKRMVAEDRGVPFDKAKAEKEVRAAMEIEESQWATENTRVVQSSPQANASVAGGSPILYNPATNEYVVGIGGPAEVHTILEPRVQKLYSPETELVRTRVQEVNGERAVWFTSESGAMVQPRVAAQVVADLRDAGMVKDSYALMGVPEGRTVGEFIAYAQENFNTKPSRSQFKTVEEYEQAGLAPTSVVEEGVAGQTAIAFEGERITGDTQLGMGAIDEGGGFFKPTGEKGRFGSQRGSFTVVGKGILPRILAWNKKMGQKGFFDLRSERVRNARRNMTDEIRARWDANNEKIEALEREVSEAFEGDLSGGAGQSKDILARVRELGIDDLSPTRSPRSSAWA
jgi:hypothetical protein